MHLLTSKFLKPKHRHDETIRIDAAELKHHLQDKRGRWYLSWHLCLQDYLLTEYITLPGTPLTKPAQTCENPSVSKNAQFLSAEQLQGVGLGLKCPHSIKSRPFNASNHSPERTPGQAIAGAVITNGVIGDGNGNHLIKDSLSTRAR